MSSKTTFFIANWKMNGLPKNYKEINKVGAFLSDNYKQFKKIIVYCPPMSLLTYFSKKNTSKLLNFGSQDISVTQLDFGPQTGSVSPKMVKLSGAKFVLIGHSEKRAKGDNFDTIKKKIISANKTNLKIIFCIGESLQDYKKNNAINILKKQLSKSLVKNLNFNNLIFAYEPIWSIGTGLVPNEKYLNKIFSFLKQYLKDNYKINTAKILYGGSVSADNINNLKLISNCSGFLVGGASLKAKNFIEIIRNYYT